MLLTYIFYQFIPKGHTIQVMVSIVDMAFICDKNFCVFYGMYLEQMAYFGTNSIKVLQSRVLYTCNTVKYIMILPSNL